MVRGNFMDGKGPYIKAVCESCSKIIKIRYENE